LKTIIVTTARKPTALWMQQQQYGCSNSKEASSIWMQQQQGSQQ
jgi:hypothetical protein